MRPLPPPSPARKSSSAALSASGSAAHTTTTSASARNAARHGSLGGGMAENQQKRGRVRVGLDLRRLWWWRLERSRSCSGCGCAWLGKRAPGGVLAGVGVGAARAGRGVCFAGFVGSGMCVRARRWEGGGGGRQRRRAAWAGARGARAVSAERTYDWAGRAGAREYETETGRSLWRTTAPRLMATVFFFGLVSRGWQLASATRRGRARLASPRLASRDFHVSPMR